MKLQEHEIISHFEFEKDRWSVKLDLDYNSSQTVELVIEVIDTLTARVNATRWKTQDLVRHAQMKFIFPSLEQLFYYLARHTNSLNVSQDVIDFHVALGQGMKNRTFNFSIMLQAKAMTKQDTNELRIRLLENRLQKQMKIKDQQIKALQRQVQILTNRVGSSQIKQKSSLSNIEVTIKPHPSNPDNQCFQFTAGQKGLRVKRVNVDNWVNFISTQISNSKPTILKIKVWRLTQKALCLGIGTSNMFGVHNYHQIQFLNFDFELSQIAVNQRKLNAPSSIKNGTILTLKCDPKIGKLDWINDDIGIGSAFFPNQMKNQAIYLIAYFKYAGDQFQFWQE